MKDESIRDFYSYAILPQFGIDTRLVDWREIVSLEADFEIRYFSTDSGDFALTISDNHEDPETLLYYLNLNEDAYEYIPPLMSSDISPSLQFVKPVSGLQYVDGVTDFFSLIKFTKDKIENV